MTAPNIRMSNDRNTKYNNKNNFGNIIILNNAQENIIENNDKIQKVMISLSALNFKLKRNNNNISTNFENNKYSFSNKKRKRRNIINICGTSLISDISNFS